MNGFTLHQGDCLEILRGMADDSVDSIVTDPPYGLGKEPDALAMLADWLATGHHDVNGTGFMGKAWDAFVPQPGLWRECLRVLKPGGHLLAFAGTRTHDLMTLGLRIAGFEIRDTIMWVYGSGFPKSLDVSKAIDKAAVAEREVVGPGRWNHVNGTGDQSGALIRPGNKHDETAPATDAARQWSGWGTALKPALEPITVARKPLIGTVAANVLEHGTGALNIDGCRVEGTGGMKWETPRGGIWTTDSDATARLVQNEQGRWPANLIHDGSDEVVALFPGDSGSAARFFYCAKASRKDRNEGCEGMVQKMPIAPNGAENAVSANHGSRSGPRENHHPTVKPTALMRYLCRLVTPPGGTVLDPFTGSGSTGKAALLEGFAFIGIEREAEYVEIARARLWQGWQSADA